MLESALLSLPEVLLEERQTVKPNYTPEYKPLPFDSGGPKEHACTGTACLKRGPKKIKMWKLCRETRQRMQILTYFSLLAGRGHEAAAITALQAQEMSRSPAKTSAAMPLPDTGCYPAGTMVFLPRQRDHKHPDQQKTE